MHLVTQQEYTEARKKFDEALRYVQDEDIKLDILDSKAEALGIEGMKLFEDKKYDAAKGKLEEALSIVKDEEVKDELRESLSQVLKAIGNHEDTKAQEIGQGTEEMKQKALEVIKGKKAISEFDDQKTPVVVDDKTIQDSDNSFEVIEKFDVHSLKEKELISNIQSMIKLSNRVNSMDINADKKEIILALHKSYDILRQSLIDLLDDENFNQDLYEYGFKCLEEVNPLILGDIDGCFTGVGKETSYILSALE